MKSALAIIILATAVFAESTSNFEVKELDASTVQSIEAAEAKLSVALVALKGAQEVADAAKQNRDNLVGAVKSMYGAFDGQCTTAGNSNTGVYAIPSRSYRHVEVKGKYALITQGTETCSAGITWTSSNTFASPVSGIEIDVP